MVRRVDVVVLSRDSRPLDPRVERGLAAQRDLDSRVLRVTAAPDARDVNRWQTIARGRNHGKRLGNAPWLMFLDDDVALRPGSIAMLLESLEQRPLYGAVAADYLGEASLGIAPHVAMGATLFRRSVLDALVFRSAATKCECQCACDDLRAKRIAIDYLGGLKADHLERAPAAPCAPPAGVLAPTGVVLTAFDALHARLFRERFLASLRAAGNSEQVIAVAYGLRPRQTQALQRMPNVRLAPRRLGVLSPARRRLLDFAEIVGQLPAETPVAHWDAGDVVFQGRLDGLWEQVLEHPDRLLAVAEPWRHPENSAVARWTLGIADPLARQRAFELLTHSPVLNGGFAAGTARTLLKYFRAAESLLCSPALLGSSDWGDQTALNLYCHSNPTAWRQIDERWNYCLCGRPAGLTTRAADGQFLAGRGAAICVVHGNAGTLPARAF